MDNMEQSNEAVIGKLMCTHRLHRRALEKQVQETGLYRAQHRTLMHLAKNPGISQTELAKSLEVTTATVTVTLKKLEQEGYVTKKVDYADNRFHQIEITEKGKKIVEESEGIFSNLNDIMLQNFSQKEKEQLLTLLERVCDNLQKEFP